MEPRPAATVIVARPGRGGVEVLVGRRGSGTRFAPGFVVFPGGVVDPSDADLAQRLFGDAGEAARACAMRELYEETGLLITAAGPVESPGGRDPFETLDFEVPPPDLLVEVARWIAPEFLEVRFDARFFAVAAPPGLVPVADGVEVDEMWWTRPSEVLVENARGRVPLMWPTLVTLEALSGCRSVDEVLALRLQQVPPPLRRGLGPRRRVGYPEGMRTDLRR